MSKDAEKTTTELVPSIHSNYMISRFEIDDLGGIIQDNLGGEQFDILNLNKIKVPTGGSKTWTIQTSKGEVDTPTINGVLVYNKVIRVYYEKPFGDGAALPPNCISNDGMTGVGVPGGSCLSCPYSKFGSSPDGRKTACPTRRLMFFILEDSMLPSVLSVPPSGLKDAKKYLLNLSSEGKRANSVVTQLTLKRLKSTGGIDYSAVEFKEIGPVSSPEKFIAYSKAFKQLIESSEAAFVGSVGSVVNSNLNSEDDIPF